MRLTEEDIQTQLTRRRPGQSAMTTSRDEKDKVTIMYAFGWLGGHLVNC